MGMAFVIIDYQDKIMPIKDSTAGNGDFTTVCMWPMPDRWRTGQEARLQCGCIVIFTGGETLGVPSKW
jgi:hypothetical protein